MKSIKLRRGLDLKINGQVEDTMPRMVKVEYVAISPDDFPGFLPKTAVNEGDSVSVGSPLMYDKKYPEIKLVSPVNGTVEAIVRGNRRHIERIIVKVKADPTSMKSIEIGSAASDSDSLRKLLQNYGLWACFRQRPYDVVPAPDSTPRDIFVTSFDSAPLAASMMSAVEGRYLEAGVKALNLLTSGKVYVGIKEGGPTAIEGAECVLFKGPHPAGNAGVQAANIAPVNKGEQIWTLDIVTVNRIGRLVSDGVLDTLTNVAVTGPEVEKPCIVTTLIGAEIKPLIKDNLKCCDYHKRIISGNILTGTKIDEAAVADGDSLDAGNVYLRYPYRQITVIRDGDDVNEFMGWAMPGLGKMSQSPTFLSRFMPWKKFSPDARLHGGRRAMILSGEYDKVLPMDILPEYLLKAIRARDIDRMEQLGIYEVAPEDFALCEYVDASKIEIQKAVREGLDYLRKELE